MDVPFAYLELQNFQMYWFGVLSRQFHKRGQMLKGCNIIFLHWFTSDLSPLANQCKNVILSTLTIARRFFDPVCKKSQESGQLYKQTEQRLVFHS